MFTIIVIALVIMAIVLGIMSADSASPVTPPIQPIKKTPPGPGHSFYDAAEVYARGVYSFPIKGMTYRNLRGADRDYPNGYVKIDYHNPQDSMAVAVFNSVNKHIGYLPSGNIKMYKSLRENHKGSFVAINDMFWERTDDSYWMAGNVDVYIGYSAEEIELLRKVDSLRSLYQCKSRSTTMSEIDEVMDKWKAVRHALEMPQFPSKLFNPDVGFLIRYTKHLYANDELEKLIEIENLVELTNRLPEKSLIGVQRRIEKAKQELLEKKNPAS